MLKLSFPLSLIAAAALTACASQETTQPASGFGTPSAAGAPAASASSSSTAVTQPVATLRAGIGRIESIGPSPSPLSASTGAGQSGSTRRVGVRMDDGTTQILDTDAPSLRTGDRIELTADGFIRQPAQ